MPASETVTRGIRIGVETMYDPTRSAPQQSRWFFLYTIRITNEGTQPAQLVSRHWVITDATGHVEEVEGPGVVGKQPTLAPGQAFEYTSGCPLPTPFGSMRGSYHMVAADGTRFEAEIAEFILREPHAVH